MDWISDIVRDLLIADLIALAGASEGYSTDEDKLSRLLEDWKHSPSLQAMKDATAASAATAEAEGRRISEQLLKAMGNADPVVVPTAGSYSHVSSSLAEYKAARDDLAIERASSVAWAKYGLIARPFAAKPRKDTTKLDLLKIELKRALSQAEMQPVPKSDHLKAVIQKAVAGKVAELMPKRLSVKKAALPEPAAPVVSSASEANRIESLLAIARKLPLRDQTALLAVLGGALNQLSS